MKPPTGSRPPPPTEENPPFHCMRPHPDEPLYRKALEEAGFIVRLVQGAEHRFITTTSSLLHSVFWCGDGCRCPPGQERLHSWAVLTGKGDNGAVGVSSPEEAAGLLSLLRMKEA